MDDLVDRSQQLSTQTRMFYRTAQKVGFLVTLSQFQFTYAYATSREIHVVSLCESRFQSFLLLSKSDRVELGSIKIKSSNRMF